MLLTRFLGGGGIGNLIEELVSYRWDKKRCEANAEDS
jgi:hypothetical protein